MVIGQRHFVTTLLLRLKKCSMTLWSLYTGLLREKLAGEVGGFLWALSAANGEPQAKRSLSSPPCLEGLAAAQRRIFISTEDGHVLCFAKE